MSFLTKLDRILAGWPDKILSGLLLTIAAFCVLLAWKGKAAIKAFFAAWFLLP